MTMMQDTPVQYVVFSDDWGRHPSSCQHLVRRLLKTGPTLWVNTIGTRFPRPTMADLGKVITKLRQWGSRGRRHEVLPDGLTQIHPLMWPGFNKPWQRRFNANQIAKAVEQTLGPGIGDRRIAITTLPITADLVGRLDVDRWVYYCVDDFSVWPGLDGPVMERMEQQMVFRVDEVVAASQTLVDRMADLGTKAQLLTHGIDLAHWQNDSRDLLPAKWQWLNELSGPVYLFWGLIDQRLDVSWIWELSKRQSQATILLVGPTQDPDRKLRSLPNVRMPGPAAYTDLPAIARRADVLIMPYADLPVTRAMQPLKFKEYLACNMPVVARALPATLPWADTADLVHDAFSFASLAAHRAHTGMDNQHLAARQRLVTESWDHKAVTFEQWLRAA